MLFRHGLPDEAPLSSEILHLGWCSNPVNGMANYLPPGDSRILAINSIVGKLMVGSD